VKAESKRKFICVYRGASYLSTNEVRAKIGKIVTFATNKKTTTQ
jgi:hypothetical protein